uniref:Uncharacterized protein n=1 Tax=Picea glauca TaxID=3330 RepID=A0A124GMM2_PICGL|nr:hypothetical protein ABT39_MTgene1904 [Picea glauca]QHR89559.1 hypothetical protein Q903MT_gene3581 [Picea sitchensis]
MDMELSKVGALYTYMDLLPHMDMPLALYFYPLRDK